MSSKPDTDLSAPGSRPATEHDPSLMLRQYPATAVAGYFLSERQIFLMIRRLTSEVIEEDIL